MSAPGADARRAVGRSGATAVPCTVRTGRSGRRSVQPRLGPRHVRGLGKRAQRRGSRPVDRRRRRDGGRPQLQLGAGPPAERVAQRAAHDLVHERLIAEPHLRLGRMHVDVDASGGISMNRCTSGLRSLIDATL